MSHLEFHKNAAPDVLQLNMEIISKELNDLIVTSEQEHGMNQSFQMGTANRTVPSYMTAAIPAVGHNFQVPSHITNTFYGQPQQRPFDKSDLQIIKHNLNFYSPYQQPLPFTGVNNNNNFNNIGVQRFLTPTNYQLYAGGRKNQSVKNTTESQYSTSTATPSYEFHYLRSNGEYGKKLTTSSQGAFRKITKLQQKYGNQKIQNDGTSVDIEFDLSALDFSANDQEKSLVQHLFRLIRDLHCAVDEKPPYVEVNSDSQYEATFARCATVKSMPSTLNVQNQVKHACRKLTIFIYEMQGILNANKMVEVEMHAECEFYLNQLFQNLHQLEMYKRNVMEHKYGKFLRQEVNVQAERLSLLLEQINRQIREVHMRIVAVDWYIGVKYRGHTTAAMQKTADNSQMATLKTSKIGVINEILQMSNTPTATAESIIAAEMENPIKSEILSNTLEKYFNNTEELLLKPNNDDMLNIYKADQNKRMAKTNIGSGHIRHPVFYIG